MAVLMIQPVPLLQGFVGSLPTVLVFFAALMLVILDMYLPVVTLFLTLFLVLMLVGLVVY